MQRGTDSFDEEIFESVFIEKAGVHHLDQFIAGFDDFEEIPLVPFYKNLRSVRKAGLHVNPFLLRLATGYLSKIYNYAREKLNDLEFLDFFACLSFDISGDWVVPRDLLPCFFVTRRKKWIFEYIVLSKVMTTCETMQMWKIYIEGLVNEIGLTDQFGVYTNIKDSMGAHIGITTSMVPPDSFRIYVVRPGELELQLEA